MPAKMKTTSVQMIRSKKQGAKRKAPGKDERCFALCSMRCAPEGR